MVLVQEPIERYCVQTCYPDQSIADAGECSSGSEYAGSDVVTEQTYDAPYYRTDYGESETDTIECFHFDLQKIAHFVHVSIM